MRRIGSTALMRYGSASGRAADIVFSCAKRGRWCEWPMGTGEARPADSALVCRARRQARHLHDDGVGARDVARSDDAQRLRMTLLDALQDRPVRAALALRDRLDQRIVGVVVEEAPVR